MLRFDKDTVERLRAAVAAAEAQSDLEIVCRVVPRSDPWAALPWMVGSAVGAALLIFVLFAPFTVQAAWVVPEVLLPAALAGWAVSRWPAAVRALVGRDRMDARVLERAEAELHREAVTATRRGTGVLVMASMLEDRVVTLFDHPLGGRAPRAEWEGAALKGRAAGTVVDRMVAVIDAVGAVGARHVPALANNPNELPDEPHIG